MKQKIERLRSLMEKATPGPWSVWAEKIDGDRYAAISELTEQVQSTDPVGEHLYLLDAGGKCPATTGCGPQSWANANLIVEAINALPDLLSHIDALEARVEKANADSNRLFNIAVHHEDRADAAERALAEAVEVLREIAEVPNNGWMVARAFLTKMGEK